MINYHLNYYIMDDIFTLAVVLEMLKNQVEYTRKSISNLYHF
jgi:hypothetical protein